MSNYVTLGLAIAGIILGAFLGYYKAETEYQELLLEQAAEYKKTVEEAKRLEQHWKDQATTIENEYQEKINSIQQSNSELVNRLRKQLAEYSSRVSKNSSASSKPNAKDRKTRISEELNNLVEFSQRCSKRADELIIQVNALQDWIKKYN